MLRKGGTILVCLSCAAGVAAASNFIEEWGQAPGIAYLVFQDEHTVLIMAPGTYKFQATNGTELGHIEWVHVAEGVTGTVDLYILRDPNDANDPNGPPYDPDNPWGALDVGMVGFTSETPPAGLTLRLRELRVAGQLGPDPEDPPTRATAAWIGNCVIGGAVRKDVVLESMDLVTFSTPELDGNLEITGTYPNLGTISVTHFNAPYEINIAHDFDGDIILGDGGNQEPVSGKLSLGRDARGSIATYPGFAGSLVVVRDLYATLFCGTLYGVVDICGSVASDFGRIQTAYVRGTLLIGGDIASDAVNPRVIIWGAIARDPNDPNAPNARVEIGSPARILNGTVQAPQGIGETGVLQVNADIGQTGLVAVSEVYGTLRASGAIHGALSVQAIHADSLVEITGTVDQAASVTVSAGTLGTLHVAGYAEGTFALGGIGEGGVVQIDGDWGGMLTTGNVLGSLKISGRVVTASGTALTIEGAVGSNVAPGEVSIGSENGGLSAPIEVHGAVAELGMLEVHGPLDSRGRILVTTDVLGTLEVHGNTSADQLANIPRISLEGSVLGSVLLLQQQDTDGLSGTLSVSQDIGGTGLVQLVGDLATTGAVRVAELAGRIEIDGAAGGTIEVLSDIGKDRSGGGPAVSVGKNLTGEIRVYGSLFDIPGVDYEVYIGDRMPFPGAFVVDFAGYNGNKQWESSAAVFVQHADPNDPNSAWAAYYGNTAAARVYRVARCVGDMDGDEGVSMSDITPFVAAQEGVAQYAALEPGLEGSMVYHADCNGDGILDFQDINPFIALVTAGRCGLGTDDGGGGGAEMMMYEGGEGVPNQLPPEELAAVLAANVAPEMFDGLLSMVLGAIDSAPDEETQAYWQAVYVALTQ